MRWIKFLFSLALLVGFSYLLLTPIDPLPTSVGTLLDPFSGFWRNARLAEAQAPTELDLPGLTAPVEVVYDERGVPHIFAQNLADLYFAQGYVTAYDRLWQMEFQIRASAGRLAEVLGEGPNQSILTYDRKQRRLGMGIAAEASLKTVMPHDTTRRIMQAYSDGVNAYIQSLGPDTYPIEYKFLGHTPEPWSPLKTCYLLKYIAQDIASYADDLPRTLALSRWGKAAVEILYPDYPYEQTPVIPSPKRPRRLRLRDLPVAPAVAPEDYDPIAVWRKGTPILEPDVQPGSNNWVIAGSKTESGAPILANDPHLGLNLPSIWYEVQLHTPDMNVYGASMPGAPSVIIGFTDSIAWGITAASQDVLDYYAIRFKDDSRKQYWYNGNWQVTDVRYDTLSIKGQAPVIDTIILTHHGPVMYDRTFGAYDQPIAAQWIAHQPSNELLSFFHLNQADNYQDYLQALETYACPAINLVYAAVDGDIALWHTGRFPNRWPGQGKYVLDGSKEAHDWQGNIPLEGVPHAYNPEQGYLSSANQHPTDQTYPYYYLGGFDEYRGRKLYELLAEKDTFSFEDMKRIQLNAEALFAEETLHPLLLAEIDTPPPGLPARAIFDSLQAWQGAYVWGKAGPYLYDRWWSLLYREIWDEYATSEEQLAYPDRSTTVGLLLDSVTYTFYRKEGDTTAYTRQDLIQRAFNQMTLAVLEEHPDPADWVWEKRKATDIRHLTRVLSGFSRTGIPTQGRGTTLNATGRFSGPSWRMIVELSEPIKAQGIYPGGQSGRPGSRQYEAFIETWRKGEYYDLWLMQGPEDARYPVAARSLFRPDKETQ